jgi:predicted short-subunit dehydrogenase-like oxidoreductase (DUF2520 family)
MNISIVGPGRAGGALAIAASRSGHTITSIEGRSPERVDSLLRLVPSEPGIPDLMIIAVSDEALPSIHDMVGSPTADAVVHVSGAVGVDVLEPFREEGAQIGSFHPLQTMPDAATGAERLAGASVAITADEPLATVLHDFALSLGCRPFSLADAVKPLYHAASAAAANATIASLDVAHDLYRAAGVDPEHSRALVEAVVANAFTLGPAKSLTGPIARGDVSTVVAQIEAVRRDAPATLPAFLHLCRAIVAVSRSDDAFDGVLE